VGAGSLAPVDGAGGRRSSRSDPQGLDIPQPLGEITVFKTDPLGCAADRAGAARQSSSSIGLRLPACLGTRMRPHGWLRFLKTIVVS
jgi:hypothetical protein